MYTDVISRVPPAQFGAASINHDTPSPFERLRGAMSGQPLGRESYCRLLIDGKCYMTDAEFERRTNREFMTKAHGDVLIAGLGIGLILDPLFDRCTSVTVIEKSSDVIGLVARHYPKATIIHADIFDWKPPIGSMWDTIYFDIWPTINADEVKAESRKLERKFKKYLRDDGYMQSWNRIALEAIPRSRR